MKQHRIYIAGKVSGEDYNQTYEKFCRIEKMLEGLGHEAVNPMKLVSKHLNNWGEEMKICISKLMECDSIYLLNDWADSRGAKLEYDLANALGYRLISDTHVLEMRQQVEASRYNCEVKN